MKHTPQSGAILFVDRVDKSVHGRAPVPVDRSFPYVSRVENPASTEKTAALAAPGATTKEWQRHFEEK